MKINSRKEAIMFARLWVSAAWVAAGIVSLAPQAAKADETLMIAYLTFDANRRPRIAAKLAFLHRNEINRNNLGKPDTAPSPGEFSASMQGRLAMNNPGVDERDRPVTEWRLVSPFRNLPYNQWPPFRRTDPKLGGRLCWAPDGKRFLIWYARHKRERKIVVHHAGSAPLLTIRSIPAFNDKCPANMQWGNDSNHMVYYHEGTERYYLVKLSEAGSVDWSSLARPESRTLFDQKQPPGSKVVRFHFSPDGRQVAFVNHVGSSSTALHAGQLADYRYGVVDEDKGTDRYGWNAQKSVFTQHGVRPRMLPLSWTQDSKRFYYYHEQVKWLRRSQRDSREWSGLKEVGRREQMVRRDLKVYDVAAGRAWRVMALNWTPVGDYRTAYAQPLVSEDGRYLAFLGLRNIKYQQETSINIREDLHKMQDPHLVVVDLERKTERSIHRGYAWAAFINTQEGDDTSPRPAHKEPRPRLPQYFLRIKPTVATRMFSGTRCLRIPFEGKAPELPQARNKLQVEVTFSYKDGPLKDYDGKYRNDQGHVANFVQLANRAVKLEADRFSSAVYVPLNDLDFVSDSEETFRVHMALKEGERVLVKAKPAAVTVPAAEMPRVWIQGFSARKVADSRGSPVINVKAQVLLHKLAYKDIRLEAIVVGADDKPVLAREARYRVTGNTAGAQERLRPTSADQSHSVNLSIPLAALVLKPGQRGLRVHLRALSPSGDYIGGTRPRTVEVPAPATK